MTGLQTAFTVAMTLKAYDEMSKVVGRATDQSWRQLNKLQEKLRATSESLTAFGRGSIANGLLAAGALAGSIKAFSDLEEAQTSLEVGLLKQSGEASEKLAEINALAVQLGTTFPGTTRDVTAAFSTLIKLGIEETQILGGLGEAAVQLGAVLKVPYATAAEAAVKLRNATGVADKDMLAFFDTIQRASFMGVNLESLTDFFSRASTGMNLMKLRGLESAREVSVLGAMLIRMGISGDRAGTNLSLLLSQFGNQKKILETNAALAQFGIHLDVVDLKTGRFKGVRNLFVEMEKLKSLNAFQRTKVFASLFGQGVFELAEINKMIEEGSKGFDTFKARMDEQANLQQRTAVILKTLSAVWDAAYGTWINATAALGRAIAPELKMLVDRFGDLSAWLDLFVSRHPILAKMLGLSTLGFAGLAIGIGGGALALGALINVVDKSITGLRTLHNWSGVARSGILRLLTVSAADRLRYLGIAAEAPTLWGKLGQRIEVTWAQLQRAARVTWSWTEAQWASAKATIFNLGWLRAQASLLATTVRTSVISATTATWGFVAAQWASLQASIAAAGGIRAMTMAMLSNPVTAILVGIAAAALLIYKFWGPLAGFFKGLFRGIGEGWNEIAQRSIVLRIIGTTVWAILTPLRWLYNLIVWIVSPIEDVGHAWESTGARIGQTVGRLLAMLTNIPGELIRHWYHAGQQIPTMLARGIADLAGLPVKKMREIAQSIKNLLPFSPAKEGPLATLHQVRIIETIAETVRPQALIQRLTATLKAAAVTLTPSSSPAGPRLALAGAGTGPMYFTFNIKIEGAETGGTGKTKDLVQRIAKETSLEFEKIMRRKYAI